MRTDQNEPEISVEGDIMTIMLRIPAVDQRQELRVSASGKSAIVATTSGFTRSIPRSDGCKVSLNVTCPVPA